MADLLAGAPAIATVRRALAGAGLAERGWIVGGTIRDALMGRPVRDVDLAVAGDPEPAARAIAREAGGPVFPLSEAFGAWRCIQREEGWTCDVSPLQGDSIEADLGARDFTVNAMALPLGAAGQDEVIDPHGGRADVEAGTLRVLGGPRVEDSAYAADPLRPLRLARLAAELDLRPDEQTERLTREAAARVREASPERVFAELRRTVGAAGALEGIALADRLGLVAATLPELEALHGVEQSHFHHLDVFDHTLEVLARVIELEQAPDQAFGGAGMDVAELLGQPLADDLTGWEALRLGALVHDVGKPATRAVRSDGRVTFLGHDAVGEEMVSKLCRRLRTSERLRIFLAGVTRHHLRLGFLVHERPLSARALYRYLAASRPVEVEVTVLSCADRLATRGAKAEPAIAAHLELAREVLPAALRWRAEGPPRPPVRGDELARALDLAPGPEVGRLLAALAEAHYAGEIATPEEAVELARSLRQNSSP